MTRLRIPVDIDFATRKRNAWGYLLLAVGLVALAVAGWDLRVRLAQLAELEATAAHLARALDRSAPPAAAPAVASEKLRILARDLQRPWPALFAALEGAQQPGVLLLSIEPDVRTGWVTIGAQTDSFGSIAGYLSGLTDGSLQEVTLASHQQLTEPLSKPYRFVVQARWDGDAARDGQAPGERP